MNQVNNPEPFLLRQLAGLEADLDRYGRILDALRLEFMRDHACSDVEAELLLLEDAGAKQIRRHKTRPAATGRASSARSKSTAKPTRRQSLAKLSVPKSPRPRLAPGP